MKSTYKKPIIKVVNIKVRPLLITSSVGVAGDYQGGDVLGRDFDFDDEE